MRDWVCLWNLQDDVDASRRAGRILMDDIGHVTHMTYVIVNSSSALKTMELNAISNRTDSCIDME